MFVKRLFSDSAYMVLTKFNSIVEIGGKTLTYTSRQFTYYRLLTNSFFGPF